MGDRCSVQISFRNEADARSFGVASGEGERFWDETNDTHRLFVVTVHEANWAWVSQLEAAAKAGVEFFGKHDAGSEYPEEDFVTSRKKVLYLRFGLIPYEVVGKGRIVIPRGARGAAKAFYSAQAKLFKKWGLQ